ncbi:flagellar hook-associated protein FlgK [Helicobacter bizzozeronii CIII-1]|uniref:Flagellar hook-associated protein FlgK n=1 Tax=Helicobacter bizzozeronii (strain CIII-1) TaxID=1002804 RepID=F8KQY2_HELBC|nr:flagellar hook-associated protein FlgK [Helicobacter bizzozeronii CIII-1]
MQVVKKEHDSISAVNTDEEMVNLIKFQGGYAANAKCHHRHRSDDRDAFEHQAIGLKEHLAGPV